MGISSCGLLGAVAVGTGGAGHTSALLVAGACLGAQLAHLLGQLTAGEIGIGLTSNCSGTGGLLACGFAMLGHGIATGQNQGTTGILDSATLRGRCTTFRANGKLGGRGTQ